MRKLEESVDFFVDDQHGEVGRNILFFDVFVPCPSDFHLSLQDERTAFFFACEHCHKPVAEFLVRQAGVDVNAKDGPSGHSPLHRACIAGQTREKVRKWL